jgi:hypothetical protein
MRSRGRLAIFIVTAYASGIAKKLISRFLKLQRNILVWQIIFMSYGQEGEGRKKQNPRTVCFK